MYSAILKLVLQEACMSEFCTYMAIHAAFRKMSPNSLKCFSYSWRAPIRVGISDFIQYYNQCRDLHPIFSCFFETFGSMSEIMFSSDSVSKIIFQQLKIHECPCADPGIFVRGGPGQSDKKSSDVFFFFLVLSLFYRSQTVNFKEIYHCSRFQRGSNICQGGPTFSRGGGGGVQLLQGSHTPFWEWGRGPWNWEN